MLTQVSRIGDLRVISRTGMTRIAERDLSIPEIARQLGVSHVLEGDPGALMRHLRSPGGAMSSPRYAIEGLGEAIVFRFIMAEDGLETALSTLENLRTDDDRWLDMLIDGQIAELLLATGEAAAARERARVALAHGISHIETTGFVPGNEPGEKYAQLGYVACMAGDAEAATGFRATAEATPNMNPAFSTTDRLVLAMAEAACGDVASAWPKLLDAQAPWRDRTGIEP